jgi:hypothetical protein
VSTNIPQTYLIYREVTGTLASEAEFQRRLRRFSSGALLRVCSVLNMLLTQWVDGYDKDTHARLVHSFFPTPLANALLATGRPVFHRHQLLFIAQEALRHCDNTHHTPLNFSDFRQAGIMMLMASELLARPAMRRPASSEELARRISSILPDMETNGPVTYQRKVARSLAMCTDFVDQLRGTKNYFDIRKLFRDGTQIELDTFYALLFGCFSRFLNLERIKASTKLLDYAVGAEYFRKCAAITPAELNQFFAYMSADVGGFAADVQAKNPHRNEFTVFRNKPLFADNGNYLPLDLSLLADKMESGVFWSVHSQIDAKKRDNFHQFWGEVFELYVSWLIKASVNGHINSFFARPRYLKRVGAEVCDAIVLSGASAIMIECKGSTLTAESKYGGDPKVLDAELKQKFVGTENSRKGVRQLIDAIKSLFAKDACDAVRDVDLRKVERVIPILLTRDDIGSAFNFSAYLNFHFQELIQETEFTRSISPLSALSAADLESLSPYLVDMPLSDALLARIEADKDLIFPFWNNENTVLKDLPARPSPLLNAQIEKLGELCMVRLAPPEDGPALPAS